MACGAESTQHLGAGILEPAKVERFLADLSDHVRGSEPELLKKIAEGDWSDETQKAVDEAVKQFAEDFGYDLDEEGHPLEEAVAA